MTNPTPAERLEEIRPEVVARMATELESADASPTAAQLFTRGGRAAPVVRWSPDIADLPVEGLRFLLEHWNAARGSRTMPPVEAIDPIALKPVLGNLLILDALEHGADFRFRLFGTQVAMEARFDWTGYTVDEMRRTLKGPGPAFYLAGYRALMKRREPLFTLSPAMVVLKDRHWARLVLPYGDVERKAVERVVVGNYVIGDSYVSDADEQRLAQLREEMRASRPGPR